MSPPAFAEPAPTALPRGSSAPPRGRHRTPVGLWIWGYVTLGFAAFGAGILGFWWLAALQDPDGGLLVGLFAIGWLLPSLVIALSGIVLAFYAIAEERLGVFLVAMASLICHLPMALTVLGIAGLGVL